MTTYIASTPSEYFINIGRRESDEKIRQMDHAFQNALQEKDHALQESQKKNKDLFGSLQRQRENLIKAFANQEITQDTFTSQLSWFDEMIKRYS